MKMARFATIVTPKVPKGWEDQVFSIGDFEVGCIINKAVKDGHLKLVAATTTLPKLPILTEKAEVAVDTEIRQAAEQAIEHYANLISVSNYMRRSINSTMPALAFMPQTPEEIQFLNNATDIATPSGNRGIPGSVYEIDINSYGKHLADRLDGVAILAEALGHNQASGRFRDSIRCFERAFARAGQKLIKPLAAFLSAGSDGYSRPEIARWIEIRDGVTHADKRDEILFEGDVAWVVERVTQAVYDVLLNKQVWRNPDPGRRIVWSSPCGTVNADCGLRANTNHDMLITFKVFDEYRRFPLNLDGALTGIPAGWWAGSYRRATIVSDIPFRFES